MTEAEKRRALELVTDIIGQAIAKGRAIANENWKDEKMRTALIEQYRAALRKLIEEA